MFLITHTDIGHTHNTLSLTLTNCLLIGVMQMAAQVKQLEQRLMALREEVREKEAKARQAEGSVQDLKLQLEDLKVYFSRALCLAQSVLLVMCVRTWLYLCLFSCLCCG